MGRSVFQGIIFQHKYLNRAGKLIRNSKAGYDYLFNNNRLLFSRTIEYCFPNVFGIFCNLIIPKQGIEMQFFPERIVDILKKWSPPFQVTFKCPPPLTSFSDVLYTCHWSIKGGFPTKIDQSLGFPLCYENGMQ